MRSNSLSIWTLVLIILCGSAVGQSSDPWIRVASDDGRFSIEIPDKYNYFHNADGFMVSNDFNDYWVKDMNSVVSFPNGSLLSLEMYEGPEAAMDKLYDKDKDQDRWEKSPIVKRGKFKIKTLTRKVDDIYAVSYYVAAGERFFVMTAASRSGETAETRRFLESIQIAEDEVSPLPSGTSKIRQLKPYALGLEKIEPPPSPPTKGSATPKKAGDDEKPLVLIRTFAPSFVQAARAKATEGTVRLRATFAEDGHIPKIQILKELPNGLLRQSIFAMMRVRFLPMEKAGKALTITRPVTFSFGIR